MPSSPKTKRVGIYARASDDCPKTVRAQTRALLAYARSRGWTVSTKLEEEPSGRAKRKTLLKMVKSGEVDVVAVWRLDRWARSLSELVTSIEALRSHSVDFASLSEGFDTSTKDGQAVGRAIALLSRFEDSVRSQRTLARVRQVQKTGDDASFSKEVRRLHRKGWSRAEIAVQLGIPVTKVDTIVEDSVDDFLRARKHRGRV